MMAGDPSSIRRLAMSDTPRRIALRGPYITWTGNPFVDGSDAALRYESDGVILIKDGKIEAAGDYATLSGRLLDYTVMHYPDKLIVPGFIDTHVHYPQTQIIGAYGAQ